MAGTKKSKIYVVAGRSPTDKDRLVRPIPNVHSRVAASPNETPTYIILIKLEAGRGEV